MTQYRITVTTTIDDVAKRFSTAEAVANELTRFAVWNRVAFADKMSVGVEPVYEQSENDGSDTTGN